jgi:acetyl-CoA carboxylase carboxyltransferase component
VYEPTAVGPFDAQVANGVIDIAVPDEGTAVAVAKQYLAYFSGADAREWSCADQRLLRHLVPENRVRVYDVRAVMDAMFDTGSVLELRHGWAAGMVTALARVEGRPLGVVANDPAHLGGAIDVDAADKAARFLQLCDAFDLPVVFLCDTPGFMVGPDHEERAAVRHVARLFVTGANLTVPFGTIVLRKGYGLGAQGMAGGSFRAPAFCVSWPTGEFGGMNIEGAVRLGWARELAAITDPDAREREFRAIVERQYEQAAAINIAMHFELDDVIDPADSRTWIRSMLTAPRRRREGKKRPYIDTW